MHYHKMQVTNNRIYNVSLDAIKKGTFSWSIHTPLTSRFKFKRRPVVRYYVLCAGKFALQLTITKRKNHGKRA